MLRDVFQQLLSGSIWVDGTEISPDSIPTHAKAVCDVVYAHDNGIFAELYGLRKLEDVEDKPKTKTVTKNIESIKSINGIPTQVFTPTEIDEVVGDRVQLVDSNGKGIFKKGEAVMIFVQETIKGKKVSKADQDRLAELEANVDAL